MHAGGAAPLRFRHALGLNILRVRVLNFVTAIEHSRNPLKRFYGRNDLHFVTFSHCLRRPYLGTIHAHNRFVQILDEVRSRFGLELLGYVVMPEHVHLLMNEPETVSPPTALPMLKVRTPLKAIRL